MTHYGKDILLQFRKKKVEGVMSCMGLGVLKEA